MLTEAKSAVDIAIQTNRQNWEESFRNPSKEFTVDAITAREEYGIGVLPKVSLKPSDVNYETLFAQTRQGDSGKCEVNFEGGGSAIWQDPGCESARNNSNVQAYSEVFETGDNDATEILENTTGDTESKGVSWPLIWGGLLTAAGVLLAWKARREGPGQIENPRHNRNVSSSERGYRGDYEESPYGPGGAEQDRFLAEQYVKSGRKARDQQYARQIETLRVFADSVVEAAIRSGDTRIYKSAVSERRFIDKADVTNYGQINKNLNQLGAILIKEHPRTRTDTGETLGEAYRKHVSNSE